MGGKSGRASRAAGVLYNIPKLTKTQSIPLFSRGSDLSLRLAELSRTSAEQYEKIQAKWDVHRLPCPKRRHV